ncbi:MAG: cellulase family glycosylhydrolase [Acidimicrobiia bacterium]|nr:cellulase family glycosylhydrolase [Acidimicrobiia bacterium]
MMNTPDTSMTATPAGSTPGSSGSVAGRRPRRRRALVTAALMATAALLAAACVPPGGGAAPRAAVGHEGRWLTDSHGRVLLLHGVNLVAKVDGETPAEMGFGADDAAWLADNGFDVVRLGLTAGSVMPEPGVIDHAYLDSFFTTVDELTAEGLLVLIDLHQDGWGPTLGSDGFPGWMTITDGEPNTGTPFPLYYVTNPAIQAAFDNLWADTPGAGGVPLQERVAAIFEALAERASHRRGILGYDLLNEPWPGRVWEACALDTAHGCPEQDARLDAYNARMAQAVRTRDRRHLVFGEPYVLFNFGNAPTNVGLPGDDPRSGLSYHMYTTDPALEPAVQDFALEWADRTGGALLNTEWGATTDPVPIERQISELDGALVPWIWWAYNENVIRDGRQPPTEANLWGPVVDVLVRPHPVAVAGTPLSHDFDPATRTMSFTYSTRRVGSDRPGPGHPGLSEIKVPARTYPNGYRASVTGGVVVSRPGAGVLRVFSLPGASEVRVTVAPAV